MLVCEVSTKFGLYVLITVLNTDESLPPAKDRVLLVGSNISDPEANNRLLAYARNSSRVGTLFSRILSLNELLSPLHPTQWKAPKEELDNLAMQSLLKAALGAGAEPVSLMMESIQTPPSNTLARIMSSSDIYLYADGLMTYGPTRFELPVSMGSRIRNLYYMDLLPGLKPALLREFGVKATPVAAGDLRGTIEEFTEVTREGLGVEELDGAPVFLGQYLSGLELCTPLEEVKLYARALTLCSRVSGAKKVFFKPHPTFSTGLVHMVKNALQSASFELKILDSGTLMEEYLLYYRPAFLSSVFSTGLASAREIFGIDAYYFDTDAFIQKLKPYANSNRVPAALIRYGFPEIVVRSETMPLERLQEKLDLLAGGMQPKLLLRSLADKDALLGLPVDLDDEIEVGAREQIRKHIPPAAVDYSRCAVLELDLHASPLYAGVEPVDVPANVEEEERPAAKSERLFGEGKFEEAFFVSYAALKNTPMSTRHMRLLESSSEQLGGLFKHQCELIRPLHLQAVSEKEAAEALKLEQSGETQPLEQPAEAEKGGGGSVWSGFQKWLPVSRKDEGSPL